MRDYFWYRASQLAAIKKDFSRAIELLIKAGPEIPFSGRVMLRDDQFAAIASQAERAKQYDAANHAISLIKNDAVRARAMLLTGNEIARMNQAERDRQIVTIDNALSLLEMSIPEPDTICWAGNSRYLLTMSRPVVTLDDFTARMVRIINRISTAGSDAAAGTPKRDEYVTKILARGLNCVGYIFRPVTSATAPPNPDLIEQIKVKEWRLAAMIQAEISRKYSLQPLTGGLCKIEVAILSDGHLDCCWLQTYL